MQSFAPIPEGNEPIGPPILPQRREVVITEVPDEPLTRANAKRGPIYPGCENYVNDAKALYKCFNDRFGADVYQSLNKDFELQQGQKLKIYLSFQIDKEGNLNLIDIKNSAKSMELEQNAKNAFNSVANQMNKKKKKEKGIVPAINSKNEYQAFQYSIPITFIK